MTDREADVTGSCLCGAVRFRVTGPLRPVIACHCTQCRKQTGHYLAATGALLKDFNMLEDRGLKWYEASDIAKRGFCGHCGSTLFWQGHDADYIAIAAGSIERPTGLSIKAHIFVEDKGDYYDLDDALPQFPKGDAGVACPK
ncbi:MAG: GFA family protein [Geminicoccaceae bacterium]